MSLIGNNSKYVSDPQLFSAFIELSTELMWVRTLEDEKIVWMASKLNLEKFNIPINASDQKFWFDNIHPNDLDKASNGFNTAWSDSTVTSYVRDYRFKAADNQWHYIRDKIRFIRNGRGKATKAIGVWEDNTEFIKKERKSRQLLRDLEKDTFRFKIISELSNAVMWEEDFKKKELYWSGEPKILKDFGVDKEFFPVTDWANHIHPEDAQRSAKRFKDAINSQDGTYNDEYRVIKSDGSIAHILDRGMIIRDKRGNPVRAIGGWVDITKERTHEQGLTQSLKHQENLNKKLSRREEELATSEEELRLLNAQLSANNQILTEREFVITKLQHLAKIGSWSYDPNTDKFEASAVSYAIQGLDDSYSITKAEHSILFYDQEGQKVLLDYLDLARNGVLEPFDVVLKSITPRGQVKWLRVCAWTIEQEVPLPRVFGLTYDISDFKEKEELLKSSEEKFSNAFHSHPDLMMLMRREDWVIVDVNDKLYPFLRYTPEEVLGRPAKDIKLFVHQKDREYFFTRFEANDKVEMEAEMFRKDGTIVHSLLSFNTVEFGGIKHTMAVTKDISDRKAADEKFIKAFDLSPDLMLIFREYDLTLIECNKHIEAISGYHREEIIGKSTLEFELWARPEDRDIYYEKYAEEGHSVFMESIFLRKDKSAFQGNISAKRIILQGVDHMLVVVRDITHKKQAEKRLLESEANLYAVINSSNLIIWSVDSESKLIKANSAFEKYIKEKHEIEVTQGERIGHANPRLDAELKKIWAPRYKRALAGEKYKIVEKYKGKHAEFSIGPIIDNNQILGVVVVAEDITDRVEKEIKLKEALNKVVEFKLMALRSVMNPHFFFNALSSIQYFIAQNDRKNAINYLSTFSQLVRGILEHSVSNSISLAKEVAQLKNYIVLEQLRFEDKFDFRIDVDEGLDLEGTEIPSLLVQPYVENAIIHGLYNKESKGFLTISISKEDDAILFQVMDNGVGRKRARELNKKNRFGHKSLGTAITEERMNLINNQYKVSFDVLDVVDENGQPGGTIVKIWLAD